MPRRRPAIAPMHLCCPIFTNIPAKSGRTSLIQGCSWWARREFVKDASGWFSLLGLAVLLSRIRRQPAPVGCLTPLAGACGRGWAQEQARRERTRELQDHTHELRVPYLCVDGEWHTALVPGFHNTKLENLVRPQEYQASWNLPLLGRGILHDQRLRYGRCSHCGKSGVNVYSQDTGAALDSFLGCTGWVQLELRCHSLSKLRGGAAHRYCITGPAGDVCNKAHLFALWVPQEEVPWMLRLA